MEQHGSMEQDVLPLPKFIMQFLQKRGVVEPSNMPRSSNVPLPEKEKKLFNSIETLVQARTYSNIRKTYISYLSETELAPGMLQQDYRQLLFPFFIHLASELFKLHKNDEAVKFITEFRGIQPQECQEQINSLLELRDKFVIEPFKIQITEFASHDIIRNIEAKKQTLLSSIFGSIRCEPAEPGVPHDLLFVSVGDATGNKQDVPILERVEAVQRPLSVQFHPDRPTLAPSITQSDESLYLTQALPDVAHFVTYNHNNRIADMKISQCARLLSMAMDSNVEIYRLNSTTGLTVSRGKKSTTIMSHSGKVLTTAFSNDSRYIVSGGMDCQIRVAQTEAFRPMAHYKMHHEPILSVAWDDRSGFFVGASQDRSISMWSLRDSNCLRMFVGHSQPPSKVMFSKDSSSVISCSNDLTIRVWDIGTAKTKAKFPCGRSIPTTVDVHPNNNVLACGCKDGTVILWDAVSGKYMWSSQVFENCITDVKFSGDGSLLLGSSIEGEFCAWNLADLMNGDDDGIVMKTHANASTIDSITVTDRNLICTTGRSLRSGKYADEP